MDNKIVLSRYWNANGFAVAIVASITPEIEWAAYIAGTDQTEHTNDAVHWAARRGCKLSEGDARHFFPEIDLPYRE